MTVTEAQKKMGVTKPPFEHQAKAFEFVLSRFGFTSDRSVRSNGTALLMEMGCGKTLVGIGVSNYLQMHAGLKRVLIISPVSTTTVWEKEYRIFADFPYNLKVLSGSSDNKRQQILSSEESTGTGMQVIVVNYESAWRLEKELLEFSADLVIADEGHKIKDAHTRQSKALHHFSDKARWKIMMTGTLITNRELDVYSQYRFVNPTLFGTSFYRFRNTYFDMTGYGNHTPVFRKHMTDSFLRKLHSIAFRVTKAECLDLPEVTEETRTVELEPKARTVYEQLKNESIAQLKNSEISAVNVLTKLLRLTQVTGGYVNDDDGKSVCVSKAKLDALEDIIDSSLDDGRKLVVIAHFSAELDAIQNLLEKKKIQYSVIRGGTKNRADQIQSFQENPDTKVFVGQIASAGLGITLTSASLMVFYSLSYSMSDFEQAKARIHRAGQKENCHYIYLTAKNTVDTKVIKALKSKTDLAKTLIDDWRNGENPFSD